MKAYKVSGSFMMGTKWMKYSREVAAVDEAGAKERIFSDLGSKHKVRRRYIKIDEVAEVPVDQVEDLAVKHLASQK